MTARPDPAEVKARLEIVALARDYAPTLRQRGRDWVGLCPFHKEKTPSFTVSPAKGVFHCFGCGAGGDVIELVRRAEGLPDFTAAIKRCAEIAGLAGSAPVRPRAPARPAREAASEDQERARAGEKALAIWRASRPAAGTVVETYLRGRGIDLDAIGGVPPSLRYHPSLRHGPTGLALPAMVAGVQGPDGRVVAVHRTYLRQDGRGKAGVTSPKMMLGPCWGGAVRFAAPGPRLAIAEGIETGLSVMVATVARGEELRVWAALSLGNIAGGGIGRGVAHPSPKTAGQCLPAFKPDPARPGVVLPECVREVIIIADADGADPDSGAALLTRAGLRWEGERRRVFIARPPGGMDFNDLLRVEAGAAA